MFLSLFLYALLSFTQILKNDLIWGFFFFFYVIYVYGHVIVVAEWFRMWAAYKGGRIIMYSRSDP